MKQRAPQVRGVCRERKVRIGNVIERKRRALFEAIYKNYFVLIGKAILKCIAQRVRRGAMSAASVGEKNEDAMHDK